MAAEQWAKDAVLNQLSVARESSETRSVSDLRSAIGIGHEDLTAALEELHGEGKISMAAPDEYTLLDTNAAAREDAAAARRGEVEEPGLSLEEAEAQARGEMPRAQAAARAAGAEYSRVVLPLTVAQSLDDGALGKIVKAGIDGADGRGFIFEVTP